MYAGWAASSRRAQRSETLSPEPDAPVGRQEVRASVPHIVRLEQHLYRLNYLSHHTAMADHIQPHERPPDPGIPRQEPPEHQAEMAPRSCLSATHISDTNLDGSQGGLPGQDQGSPGSGGIQYGLTRTSQDTSTLQNPIAARHRLRRIPFIGVPRAAIRARQPHRVHQGAQHMPQMAQLVDSCASRSMGPPPPPCAPKWAAVGRLGASGAWCP